MRVAVGCDHGGYVLKARVVSTLEDLGAEVVDFGTDSAEISVDYPKFGESVGKAVASGDCDLGVIMCGTGIGISIAANKVKGVRAAVVTNTYMAKLTKNHNNANVIALGGRVISEDEAEDIVRTWFTAEYEGGRHQRRLDIISKIEDENFK